jgi:hypothetical protein
MEREHGKFAVVMGTEVRDTRLAGELLAQARIVVKAVKVDHERKLACPFGSRKAPSARDRR